MGTWSWSMDGMCDVTIKQEKYCFIFRDSGWLQFHFLNTLTGWSKASESFTVCLQSQSFRTFSLPFFYSPPFLSRHVSTFFLSTNNHTSLFYFSFISIPLLSSSLVNHILCEAFKKDIKFHVIVVDSRPRLEGREALRRLVQRGIRCTYVLISAVSYILPEVIMKSQQC